MKKQDFMHSDHKHQQFIFHHKNIVWVLEHLIYIIPISQFHHICILINFEEICNNHKKMMKLKKLVDNHLNIKSTWLLRLLSDNKHQPHYTL